MIKDIQVWLKDLKESVNSNSIGEADNIVRDVSQECEHITDTEAVYCCSLLFDKDHGLLVFLNLTVSKSEFKSCKEEILKFLKKFTSKVKKKIIPYVLDIKNICSALLLRDTTAAVKAASAEVLLEILEVAVGSAKVDELKIEDLFRNVLQGVSTRLPQTVKASMYILLGAITKLYPERVLNNSEKLLNIYVKELKSQMTSTTKNCEKLIVAGCLRGLTFYLVNFTQSAEEGSKYAPDLFKYAFAAVKLDESGIARYDIPKAGLGFFAKHSAQFRPYLLENYEILYDKIESWANYKNVQMKKEAFSALEAILKEIGEELASKPSEDNKIIFAYFIHKFNNLMEESSSSRSFALALRCYGSFAAACKKYWSESMVHKMFEDIMRRCDYLFLDQSDEDKMYYLSSFIDALASIIKEMDKISDAFLKSLERLIILLIESYPSQQERMPFLCTKPMLKTFLALTSKGTILKSFLAEIVYQGIIRTCSHPSAVTFENEETNITLLETNRKRPTFEDYVPLWKGLLHIVQIKEFNMLGYSLNERRVLEEQIFDCIVETIIRILKKLDLQTKKFESSSEISSSKEDSSTLSSDPVIGLQASCPDDIQIFINLVDFTRSLLEDNHNYYFRKWMFTFGYEIIYLSSKFPLVSGFYKLMTLVFKICSKINYFQQKSENAMDEDIPEDDKSIHMAFELFMKFIKEVLLALKQYKEELLASCLHLVLDMPVQFVEFNMASLVPALLLAFDLGLSYMPLAFSGLEALSVWTSQVPEHVWQPYLSDILPALDTYLKTSRDQGEGEDPTKLTAFKSSSQAHKNLKENFTRLQSIKRKIIHLLGKLGGKNNMYLINNKPEHIARLAVSWNRKKVLKFAMPFSDMKPEIFLDPLLPRIIEVATSSMDRRAKVAACELFHALMIYLLGSRYATKPPHNIIESMQILFEKVFFPILKLACDVEEVAKQLFEPLVFQLIHWFTSNKDYESPETIALLGAILEGIINSYNPGLRDFCGRALKEFLYWSIKHTSSQQTKNAVNAKSILKRLYSLSSHPNIYNRLGAAFAFNNIYVILREEEALISEFMLEILVNYVECLALAHGDDKSSGTSKQCQEALDHIERILKEKSKLFNQKNKHRRLPNSKGFEEATLEGAVNWLLHQVGRPETDCRKKCIDLFESFVPHVANEKTIINYFEKKKKNYGAEFFVKIFEFADGRGVYSIPTISDIGTCFTFKGIMSWYDSFQASLDCYSWILGTKFLKPEDLFNCKHSKFLPALEFFLHKLAMNDINAAFKYLKNKEVFVFTPHETKEYNRSKCTAIVRTINFIQVLVNNHSKDILKIFPKKLWNDDLWNLFITCIICPHVLGFSMSDLEIMTKLPKETETLLKILQKYLPIQLMSDYKNYIRNKLQESSCDLNIILNNWDSGIDYISSTYLILGYQQLYSSDFLEKDLVPSQLIAKLKDCIYKKEQERIKIKTIHPLAHRFLEHLLHLIFMLDFDPQNIVDTLLDSTPINNEYGDYSAFRGLNFFQQFSNIFCEFFIKTENNVLSLLMSHMSNNSSIIITIVNSVLEFLSKSTVFMKDYGTNVSCIISKYWFQGRFSNEDLNQEKQTDIIDLLKNIAVVDHKFLSNSTLPHFPVVFELYLSMLTSPQTKLTFKASLLDLLVIFVDLPEQQLEQLKAHLNKFISDNFPVSSADYSSGSSKHKDYLMVIGKLMTCLESSGSLMLFEIMMSIICQETDEIFENEIQPKLHKFMKELPQSKQSEPLIIAFNLFNESNYPSRFRQAAVDRLLLNFLQVSDKEVLIKFFEMYLKKIMDKLQVKLGKIPEAELEILLISKICCYKLLELLFIRLDEKATSSPESTINKAFCDNKTNLKGTEFVKEILTLGFRDKSEDIRDEKVLLDLRRKFHCAAYNAIASAIICTQKSEQYYVTFLFSEKLKKFQFHFDNLIDKNKTYEFEIELSAPLEKKRKLIKIRENRQMTEDSKADSGFYDGSFYYLSSQYLTGSSLSEDLHHFDLSCGPQSKLLSQFSQSKRKSMPVRLSLGNERIENDYVELEGDDLNRHENMATMIGLIRHLNTNITPNEEGSGPSEMPQWMNCLCSKLKDPVSYKNVKIFIARLVVNVQEVFYPYAKFWLSPLIQLIVSGDLGNKINYFIVDLLIMMLSWSEVAIPEDNIGDRDLASRLLEFIMTNIYHSTASVYRNNKEILKTLVECWKSRLEIPYKIIYENMKQIDLESIENTIGIEMLNIILVNGFPPYKLYPGGDKNKFFQSLAKNLKFSKEKVYAIAAEVVGQIFKYWAGEEKLFNSAFHDEVTNIINTFTDKSRFITVVKKISLYYPVFIDRFINKVLFYLPSVYGTPHTYCLEILLSRVEHIPNIYLEVKNRGLINLLSHRNDKNQLAALKIVNGMLRHLQVKELLEIVIPVCDNVKHPVKDIREMAYEICMWIYDNFKDKLSNDEKQIMKQTKDSLVYGLIDEDKILRLKILQFWSNETRLPYEVFERLQRIMGELYSPSTKERFLNYTSYLLLELTSRSPDYNRKIFDHPLSECKFQEYNLTTSWRMAHSSMRPLFIGTQISGSQSATLGVDLSNQVRITQEVKHFEPTQNPDSLEKGVYDWVTQSSLSDASVSSTSGNFTIGSTHKRNYKPVGPNFGKTKLEWKEKTERAKEYGSLDIKPYHLKSRFVKDSQPIFFIKQELRRRKMREERLKEQLEKREAQVTLYRKYRTGELPDIEISYASIIAPLQAVVERDDLLSVLVMSSLASAILKEVCNEKSEEEASPMLMEFQNSLNVILSQSTDYNPSVVACIESIAYECSKKLCLDSSLVTSASQKSKQENIGIALLEQYFLKDITKEEEPKPKKAKCEYIEILPKISDWIELSRLYKSLGEYDVLRGIFESKIETKDYTRKALEAEVRRDYSEAIRLYSKTLQEDLSDGDPESDFCEEARLKCCSFLGEWKTLDKLTKVENAYDSELYLPYIMKTKVKLMISGFEDKSFIDFVNSVCCNTNKSHSFQYQYCENLNLLYILNDDYDRAHYYSDVCMKMFLQEWSAMSELAQVNRQAKLQTLQGLVELKEFVDFMRTEENFSSCQFIKTLISQWLQRPPDNIADPVFIWDDIITNRLLFMEQIKAKLSNSTTEDLSFFKDIELKLKLSFIESAREQGCFPVAKRLLIETKDKISDDGEMKLSWIHAFVSTQLKKATILNNQELIAENIIKALKELNKVSNDLLSRDSLLNSRHHLLQGSGIMVLLKLKQLSNTDIKQLSNLNVFQKSSKGNTETIKEDLYIFGFNSLKEAAHSAEKMIINSSSAIHQVDLCKAYLQLVQLCDNILREKDDGHYSATNDIQCSSAIVEYLLKAIQNGSIEARQLFPRLLQIVSNEPQLCDMLKTSIKNIPCWMFIQWISQMVALVDKKEGKAVGDILLEIAESYPQALIYHWKLSSESYCFDNCPENKTIFVNLEKALRPLMIIDDFIEALDQLSNPSTLFIDCISSLREDVEKKNHDAFSKKFISLYNRIFTKSKANLESSYRNKFVEKYSSLVQDKCSSDGSKLWNCKSGKKVFEILSSIKEKLQPGADPGNLKEYCKWFTNFKASDLPFEIEIPGQYSGKMKPLPEYHIKIVGFEEQVTTFSSLRKPRLLTIRGNDEKNHKYIVKCGEDLRLDQRIEQLFGIMNNIFIKDPTCSSLKLKLVVYNVMPLTLRIGLIEFIPKTEVLSQFIQSTADDNEWKRNRQHLFANHEKWLKSSSCSQCGNSPTTYLHSYKDKSHNNVINHYKEMIRKLPGDLLRKSLLSMSLSLEAWLVLKKQFIVSHAVLCICHYILGIGDRHLSNFMVSLETGSMIGIDFGHAFGTATQILQVPELMPFRLTNQIQNLLKPLEKSGLLQNVMIHTLRALRQNHYLLLMTMDVFIKEPSLDWQKFASKQHVGTSVEDIDTDPSCFAKEKVLYAKHKLEGANPVYVMSKELELNERIHKCHGKESILQYILDVCKGDPSKNIRAQLGNNLTVEQQVACLLDQAVDPNILCRTWKGWEPWV